MKTRILICSLLLVGPAWADVTPWQKKFDNYTKGLPKDAIALLQRIDECGHWGGEEPYDEERKSQILAAVQKLKCDRLDADKRLVMKKYEKKKALIKKIENFPAALESST